MNNKACDAPVPSCPCLKRETLRHDACTRLLLLPWFLHRGPLPGPEHRPRLRVFSRLTPERRNAAGAHPHHAVCPSRAETSPSAVRLAACQMRMTDGSCRIPLLLHAKWNIFAAGTSGIKSRKSGVSPTFLRPGSRGTEPMFRESPRMLRRIGAGVRNHVLPGKTNFYNDRPWQTTRKGAFSWTNPH